MRYMADSRQSDAAAAEISAGRSVPCMGMPVEIYMLATE